MGLLGDTWIQVAKLAAFWYQFILSGHAIEVGWFLLKEADRNSDKQLQKLAIESFIEEPLSYGWDQEHGGITYFMDIDGREKWFFHVTKY